MEILGPILLFGLTLSAFFLPAIWFTQNTYSESGEPAGALVRHMFTYRNLRHSLFVMAFLAGVLVWLNLRFNAGHHSIGPLFDPGSSVTEWRGWPIPWFVHKDDDGTTVNWLVYDGLKFNAIFSMILLGLAGFGVLAAKTVTIPFARRFNPDSDNIVSEVESNPTPPQRPPSDPVEVLLCEARVASDKPPGQPPRPIDGAQGLRPGSGPAAADSEK